MFPVPVHCLFTATQKSCRHTLVVVYRGDVCGRETHLMIRIEFLNDGIERLMEFHNEDLSILAEHEVS